MVLDSKASVFLSMASAQSSYKITELAACRHLVILSWCTLAIAPIREINRRIAQLDRGHALEQGGQREALEAMLSQVRRVASGAAQVFADRLRQIDGIAYLSSPDLVSLDWTSVWELLRDSPTPDVERRERTGW